MSAYDELKRDWGDQLFVRIKSKKFESSEALIFFGKEEQESFPAAAVQMLEMLEAARVKGFRRRTLTIGHLFSIRIDARWFEYVDQRQVNRPQTAIIYVPGVFGP